jgi:tetratricopeptide (TPR) repeat protein
MSNADFVEAVALHQAGRLPEATALYQRVLAADPAHVEAKRLLGVAAIQAGDLAEAERLLREAIAIAPTNAKSYDNLSFVLHALKRDDEALPTLRKAAELAPDSDQVWTNLGNLYIDLGRRIDAVEALRRAAAINPANLGARQQLAGELLKTGDAVTALRHLDACIEGGDANATVLGAKAVALAELGDVEGVRKLMDFDRLIVSHHIGDAHGFPTLAEFNRALADAVRNNSTLHEDQTTVNGFDTGNDLLNAATPCIQALRRFVEQQVEARRQSLPAPGHPFSDRAPKDWKFGGSWGVKMWRHGHQVTHVHHKAWLSGVYYVELPPIVRPGQKSHDGWIEFGHGPTDLYSVAKPETRPVQPVEGMMLTFPAYMWHRTIPFETASERICIAFDVVAA